ncbi:hypothetical protein ACFX5K_06190 [Rickettsiales bacterium LUAb2]
MKMGNSLSSGSRLINNSELSPVNYYNQLSQHNLIRDISIHMRNNNIINTIAVVVNSETSHDRDVQKYLLTQEEFDAGIKPLINNKNMGSLGYVGIDFSPEVKHRLNSLGFVDENNALIDDRPNCQLVSITLPPFHTKEHYENNILPHLRF